jgi:hypothetical protein
MSPVGLRTECVAQRQRKCDLQTKKPPRIPGGFFQISQRVVSALAGFEPALGLVDHVYAALATHNTAVTVPILERAERIANLHGPLLCLLSFGARACAGVTGSPVTGR